MDGFEYVLTLFGLLLGLALTEALSGLARAIKARKRVRIGWSTALLGVLIACDVVTFWVYGWSMRSVIKPTWPMLFAGFVVTAIYFLPASLIFPAEADHDHEQHFAENYRLVLAGFLVCNLALGGWLISLVGLSALLNFKQVVIFWSLVPVALIAITVRSRAVVLVCMGWLIALYPLSLVWV